MPPRAEPLPGAEIAEVCRRGRGAASPYGAAVAALGRPLPRLPGDAPPSDPWLDGPRHALLDFAEDDHEDAVIGGVHRREEGHRWLAERAAFLLRVPAPPCPLVLEGYAPPPMFAEGPLDVEIHGPFGRLARASLPEAGPFALRFRLERPWPRPFEGSSSIEVVPSRHFVPARTGGGPDHRRLSLLVRRVGFEGAQEAPPLPRAAGPHPDAPHLSGRCVVCGEDVHFTLDLAEDVRDTFVCQGCGSLARWRQLARGLLVHLRRRGIRASSLRALESAPPLGLDVYDTFSLYPVAASLRRAPLRYVTSELYDDVPLGTEVRPGHFCQDLSFLTFPDRSFDVALVTDVFEHVRLHRRAFAELGRVLRPGGALIFTVPHAFAAERNEAYVEVVDPARPDLDRPLRPPVYHGDPLGEGRALVYRVFGREIFSELAAAGFDAVYERARLPHLGIWGCEVFVCTRREDDGGPA